MARIKWTKQLAMTEALKYNTRVEFDKNSYGYEWLRRRGYLDEACEHMKPILRMWNEEKAGKEALKYNIRKDFMVGSKGAYEYLRTRRLLDKYCKHMKPVVHWDKESVFKLALKYTSRNKFQRENAGAYDWLATNNLKEKAMAHMLSNNELRFKGTKEQSGVYILKNKGKVVYVGRSLTCVNSRLVAHCRDKEDDFDEVDVFLIKNLADVAILEIYLICRYSPKLNVDSTSKYIPTLCINDYENSIDTKLNFKEIW